MKINSGTHLRVVTLTDGDLFYTSAFREYFTYHRCPMGVVLKDIILPDWIPMQFTDDFGGHDCSGSGVAGRCQYVNPVDIVPAESDEI